MYLKGNVMLVQLGFSCFRLGFLFQLIPRTLLAVCLRLTITPNQFSSSHSSSSVRSRVSAMASSIASLRLAGEIGMAEIGLDSGPILSRGRCPWKRSGSFARADLRRGARDSVVVRTLGNIGPSTRGCYQGQGPPSDASFLKPSAPPLPRPQTSYM